MRLWQRNHVCMFCIIHSQTQMIACKTTWLPPLVLTYDLKVTVVFVTMTDCLTQRDRGLCIRISVLGTYQQFHDDGFYFLSHHVSLINRVLLLHYCTNIRDNALSDYSALWSGLCAPDNIPQDTASFTKLKFWNSCNIARAHQRNIAACGGVALYSSLRDRPVTSHTRACNR